jgi:hypothetical protein
MTSTFGVLQARSKPPDCASGKPSQYQSELECHIPRFKKSKAYLNQQKPLFLPIIAYTLSTTKLEIRAK